MRTKHGQKNNIVFVGNVAFDQITNLDGYNAFVIGGSAFNSAFCASLFSGVSIEINSVVGTDFPLKILTDAGINTQSLIRVNEPTNVFVIDETKELVYSLRDLLDFSPKPDGDAWHLHVSCRKGIKNPKKFFLDIKHQSASLDVMYPSLEEKMPEILDCLALSNMLFLNNKEYEQISQKVELEKFPKLLIFITKGKNGIILKKGLQETRFESLRIKEGKSYCAIGAGDAFIGGFLGAYFSSHSFIESLSYGMAIAALSVKNFGVLHLSDHMTEIKNAYVDLSAMYKKQQNTMQELLGEANERYYFS